MDSFKSRFRAEVWGCFTRIFGLDPWLFRTIFAADFRCFSGLFSGWIFQLMFGVWLLKKETFGWFRWLKQ
ncbi:hypothetical protein A4A49_03842 [Nicotiana attenuata]|uniref:Uncharacterized protein n=1 Tax=Nicotiana attenuata TaxID=49451 RepID=A0A1J6J0H2_NICAT|nr:hypothetical protein A4A49_03842 [Nicotiana attenuata]